MAAATVSNAARITGSFFLLQVFRASWNSRRRAGTDLLHVSSCSVLPHQIEDLRTPAGGALMCGISGLADWGNTETLARMTQAQSHRGPDDFGIWERHFPDGGYIGLGSRRLAILDLSPD